MKKQISQNQFHIRTNLRSGAIWQPPWWLPQCGADRWDNPDKAASECCNGEGADKKWCEDIVKKCVTNNFNTYKQQNTSGIIDCINKGNRCFDQKYLNDCESASYWRVKNGTMTQSESDEEYQKCIHSCF